MFDPVAVAQRAAELAADGTGHRYDHCPTAFQAALQAALQTTFQAAFQAAFQAIFPRRCAADSPCIGSSRAGRASNA